MFDRQPLRLDADAVYLVSATAAEINVAAAMTPEKPGNPTSALLETRCACCDAVVYVGPLMVANLSVWIVLKYDATIRPICSRCVRAADVLSTVQERIGNVLAIRRFDCPVLKGNDR